MIFQNVQLSLGQFSIENQFPHTRTFYGNSSSQPTRLFSLEFPSREP